jgi:hypothetical protein
LRAGERSGQFDRRSLPLSTSKGVPRWTRPGPGGPDIGRGRLGTPATGSGASRGSWGSSVREDLPPSGSHRRARRSSPTVAGRKLAKLVRTQVEGSGFSRLPVASTGGPGGRPRPEALSVSSSTVSSDRRASTADSPGPQVPIGNPRQDRSPSTHPAPCVQSRDHSGDVAGTTSSADLFLERLNSAD